jgi:hypothetical protein
MINFLEIRNKSMKMSSLQNSILVNPQLKVQEEEELNSVTEDMVINTSQPLEDKVKEEVKEEEEAMAKEEETQIINEGQKTSEEVS